MVNHPNRSKTVKSVSALMKQAYNHADGGKISISMPRPGTFIAHAFLSNASAALRFTTEMKAAGTSEVSLADLTAEINGRMEHPVVYGSGTTPEGAVENLIERMAAGLAA